ncbi:DUF1090 domain-containing protein [Vreelandella nigrificans]|uniref:DUF1090 domain-containing protein n=1 Tax=Vreelandella nigrificans TaxID=2042704 RepID=A0A2A4HIC6_9GAMM|nr:DUF1090 domain-containing protein [Halomonas nigrificans]PCF94662.1 hypothetical protein CPA45_15705 [Halomonas nigrificans]
MKRQWLGYLSLAAVWSVLPLQFSHAADVLCEDKTLNLRQQLEYAQTYDNQQRIRGLQRALQSIEKNCTNERVLAEAAEKVRESEEEVSERELELEHALRDGDEDKIQKRREKLAEEVRELEEHIQELHSLQHRLNE